MKYLSIKYWKLLGYIKCLKYLQDNYAYKKKGLEPDLTYFDNHWLLHEYEISAYYSALRRLSKLK